MTFGDTRWFIPALLPVVETFPATGTRAEYAETSATLHGTVLPNWSPTLAWFRWGPDSLCLNATAPVPVGNGTNQIHLTARLGHLPAEGIYHYRMVASNTLGVVVGPEETFWAPGVRLQGARVMKVPQGISFLDPGASVARPIIALSAGSYHCLALTYDGRVIAWGTGFYGSGFPDFGQCLVPWGLSEVVAIAAGGMHSLALKRDGRVVAWGANNHRQCSVPVSLTNAVAVGAGIFLSIAATSNGTADYWGDWAAIGPGDVHPDLPELSDVVAVDAGQDILLRLRKDGTVAIFSSIMSGTPAGLTNVVAIDVHSTTCVALEGNGLITLWGNGTGPQPAGLTNVIAIANGEGHFLALRHDGSLVAWWSEGSEDSIPEGLSNVVAVAADYRTNYVLDVDGRVTQWESLTGGRLSMTNLAPLARPVEITGNVDTRTAGVYRLTYEVSNPRGIIGTATRAVIVESAPHVAARELKSNVLARLTLMWARMDSGPARERLSQAAELVRDSLTLLFWVDANHIERQFGARVFEGEQAALLNLEVLLAGEHPGISDWDLNCCIGGLLQADRLLALRAFQDTAQESSEPQLVLDAWQRVVDADRLAAAGNTIGAIESYEAAWHYSALLQLRIAARWDAGMLSLDFPFIPGERYDIEASADLVDWFVIATGTAGPDGLAHFEEPAGDGPRFYWVKAN